MWYKIIFIPLLIQSFFVCTVGYSQTFSKEVYLVRNQKSTKPNIDTVDFGCQDSLVCVEKRTILFDSLINNRLNSDDYNYQFNKRVYSLFPNPADSKVTLLNKSFADLERIEIFDYLGRHLECTYTLTSQEANIDTSSFRTGIYFLYIILDRNKSILTLIIRH